MTQPEHRYALRLQMHREAVKLLEADPHLVAIPLEAIQRWRAGSDLRLDPRLARWEDLIHKHEWSQFLADTDAGGELRRGSPLSFVVPAEARIRILQAFSTSPMRHGR